jgi:O-antigen/teichoic acid export membrane protein
MVALAGFSLARMAAAWALLLAIAKGPLWRKGALGQQLKYAVPFGASVAIGRPSQYAHQYAVSAIGSPATFALYSAGCFQLPLVDLLYTPASEVLMVEVGEMESQGRLHEAVRLFREVSGKLAAIFFPLCAFLCVCAPELIHTLFGARFLPAAAIYRVSVLGILLSVLPLDGLLRARGRTRHILVASAIKALAAVPLVALCVHLWGMMGAISAYALGELLGKVALFVGVPGALSSAGRPVRAIEAIPWRAFGQSAAAALLSAGVVPLVRYLLAHHDLAPRAWIGRLVPLAMLGAAYGSTYVAGLWLLGRRPRALPAIAGRYSCSA